MVQEMRALEARLELRGQMPPQEAEQLASDVEDTTGRLRSLLYLAGGTINTLAVSTTQVCAFWEGKWARQQR